MELIWERILQANKKDNATPEKLTLKLVEELGEFAQALHWESGYKKTDKSLEEIKENQLEEGCDVIICIMAALAQQGHDYDSIKDMLNKKITKWMKKYDGQEV